MTPDQFTAVIVALTALITAVTGLVGAVAVLWSRVEENRKAINGRMDQLITTARMTGHAEGIALRKQLDEGAE